MYMTIQPIAHETLVQDILATVNSMTDADLANLPFPISISRETEDDTIQDTITIDGIGNVIVTIVYDGEKHITAHANLTAGNNTLEQFHTVMKLAR